MGLFQGREPVRTRGAASGLRLLRFALNVIAIVFVVLAVSDLWQRWDSVDVDVDFLWVLVAFVWSSVAMFAQFLSFRALIHGLTARPMPWIASAKLYMDSQLARYTPGKIGLPAVRIAGAASVGVSSQVMATSLAAELLSWCAVGVAGGASLLTFLSMGRADLHFDGGGFSLPLSSFALVIALCCTIALAGLVIVDKTLYPTWLSRLLAAQGAGPLVPPQVPLCHVAHFASWVMCGVALALALGRPLESGLWAGAALCLSLVAGFLALLAPAGAGVREVVLSYCMAPIWGPSLALSFSILARAVSLLSDVAMWLGARILALRQAATTASSDN